MKARWMTLPRLAATALMALAVPALAQEPSAPPKEG